MANRIFASCPNCGDNLIYKSFTFDDADSDIVYMIGKGDCLCCGKKWEWEETFTLSEIRFFKEVREHEARQNLDFYENV